MDPAGSELCNSRPIPADLPATLTHDISHRVAGRPARFHRRPRFRSGGRGAGCALAPRPLAVHRGRSHRQRAAGRIGGQGSRSRPRGVLAAHRPPRPADPAGLHRYPRAQPAARRDRQPRRRVARLAGALHLSCRAALCRSGGGRSRCGALRRRAARPRHHGRGGVPDRAQGVGRRAVRRGAAARHAPDLGQGADGLQRARRPARRCGTGRARLHQLDHPLARPRPARVRGDGALRRHQHA